MRFILLMVVTTKVVKVLLEVTMIEKIFIKPMVIIALAIFLYFEKSHKSAEV